MGGARPRAFSGPAKTPAFPTPFFSPWASDRSRAPSLNDNVLPFPLKKAPPPLGESEWGLFFLPSQLYVTNTPCELVSVRPRFFVTSDQGPRKISSV